MFRGSDVKDIKIVDEQKENKEPSPPSVPDDPAILVRRATELSVLRVLYYDETFRMLITDLFRERKLMRIFPLPSF